MAKDVDRFKVVVRRYRKLKPEGYRLVIDLRRARRPAIQPRGNGHANAKS